MRNLNIEDLPAFVSRKECVTWFVVSALSLALGVWFVATCVFFYRNPEPYGLGTSSMIPAFWTLAAIMLTLAGFTGMWLGKQRYSVNRGFHRKG